MSAEHPSATKSKAPRGQTPARPPRVRGISVVLGLLLLALAGLASREAVVHLRSPAGWDPILARLPEQLTGLDARWVGALGALAVLVGLFLLAAVLSPRGSRYRRLDHTQASVWVRPVDVARFSTATAKRVPGVLSASSLAKKKRVNVTATVVGATDQLRNRLTNELQDELARAFGPDLRVAVSVREAVLEDGVNPRQASSANTLDSESPSPTGRSAATVASAEPVPQETPPEAATRPSGKGNNS